MSTRLVVPILTLFVIMFSACGGGGGSSKSTPPSLLEKSGIFSDSKVSGVEFRCGSLHGYTDINGKFIYNDGCTAVEFFIGGIQLGSVKPAFINENRYVYPADFLSLDRNETNSKKLYKIVSFLQSLDEDSNPFTGIQVTQKTRKKIEDLNEALALDKEDVAQSILQTIVKKVRGKDLLDPKIALAHYEDTLRKDLNLKVRTVAPAPAIVAQDTVYATKADTKTIMIYGEVNASIYVNGVDTEQVIDKNNRVKINLDTSGGDQTFDFDITLQNVNKQSSAPLHLSIVKDTQVPVFQSPATVSIDENKKFTFDVNASDSLNVIYTLDGNESKLFTLDTHKGKLELKNLPDYELKKLYTIQIVATDAAGNKAEQTFVFKVNHLNDEVPALLTTKLYMQEKDVSVAKLQSKDADKDEVQSFHYNIVGGKDKDKFTLSDDGNLSFNHAPSFDVAGDANKDNVYELSIQVNDGVNTSSVQNVTVEVTPKNDLAPVITSPAAVMVNENFTATVLDVNFTDGDVGVKQNFSVAIGGKDANYFTINPLTGEIAFKTAPDYETKKLYNITASVFDGVNTSAPQNITIHINHLNDIAPIINTTDMSIDENTFFVTDVNISDADKDENQTFSYGVKGQDAKAFTINKTTGVLQFATAPDYEKQKVYVMTLIVNDGVNTANKNIKISINHLNDETPVVVTQDTNVNENDIFVAQLDQKDADLDENQTFMYAIADGSDAALFSVTKDGKLSFKTAADYENALDADKNNIYEVGVTVNDGVNRSKTKILNISVLPRNDIAPVIESNATSVNENTLFVTNIVSSDADINQTQTFTYTLDGGADVSKFTLTPQGRLTFQTAPDYENALDADKNNVYVVGVKVNDGVNTSKTKILNISVLPLNDIAPVLSVQNTLSVDEGLATKVTALGVSDGDKNQTQTFSYILNGSDASFFSVNTAGVLSFKTAPDYETRQTSYALGIAVSDGVNTSQAHNVTIKVNHLNDEAPIVKNVSVNTDIDENTPISSVVVSASETDRDIDEQQTFTYILGGADANLFNLNGTKGTITFKSRPDYENPQDANKDNKYDLTLRVNDGVNTGPQSKLFVRLNNLDDVPTPPEFNGVIRGNINYGYSVGNALVVLEDTQGNIYRTYSDAFGNYKLTLSVKGPFVVKAFLPTGKILYSYNDGKHEVTNVTPVTTLVVHDFIVDLGITKGTLSEFFDKFNSYYADYKDNFSTSFTKVYASDAENFSDFLKTHKLSNFNHFYNAYSNYGFDYDQLLKTASMQVENGDVVIRLNDAVYATDRTKDYTGTVSVKGQALDAAGKAIVGASVSYIYGGVTYSTTSGAEGYYTFTLPKYTKYDLEVEYNGKSIVYHDLSTNLESNSTETTLQLDAAQFANDGTSTISGTIVNVNNPKDKITGATVSIRKDYNNQTGNILKTLTTDEKGNFSVSLENGNYTFEFAKEGWTTKYLSVFVNEDKKITTTQLGLLSDVFGISFIGVDLVDESDSGVSDTDNITNDATPAFVADQNATLLVKDVNFATVEEVNATANKSFTLQHLDDGIYTIVGVDSQGKATGGTLLTFTIDTTTVLKPTINLHSSTDSGVSDSDNITNADPLKITGTAEVNSTIVLKDGNTTLRDIKVDANGDYVQYIYASNTYSYKERVVLAEGEHNLSVVATDIAGNTQRSDILDLVIDRTGAPKTTIDLNASSDSGRSSSDNYTNDTTPTFTTDNNVTLYVVQDGNSTVLQTLNSSYLNNYTVTLSNLADGGYKIYSGDENNNTDKAGNRLNYSYLYFTIDTSVNPISLDLRSYYDTGVSDSDNITNRNDFYVYFSGAEYNSVIALLDGSTQMGTTHYHSIWTGNLSDGTHTFSATIEDLAGNINSSVSDLNVTVDTFGVEDVHIDLAASSDTGFSNSDNLTNDNTPTITTSKDTTLKVLQGTKIVQEVNTTADANGTYSVTLDTLADGTYRIQHGEDGTDTAGNPLNTYIDITIDTKIIAPSVDLDPKSDSGISDIDNITNDNTPYITGSSDNDVKLSINDVLTNITIINPNYYSYYSDYSSDAYFSNGTYHFTLPKLQDGNHTITVTAIDKAGNKASSSLDLTIDTVGIPSTEMDIVGSEINTTAVIEQLTQKLDVLPNKFTFNYDDLKPTYWVDAGSNIYNNGNYLYIDNKLQSLWETSNTSDRNATNFGNYTLRTNPSSLTLFIENFQAKEFKILGNFGRYYELQEHGELESVQGLKVYYHQGYYSNSYSPSVTHIIITNAKNPIFQATGGYNHDYSMTLSNIEEGANVVYFMFAGRDANGKAYKYSKEQLQSIVNNIEVLANATNKITPSIVTDKNAKITIKDESNATIETLDTSLVNNQYLATLDTKLSDGRYVAQIGKKGTDTAGNLLSYTAMPFVVDTTMSTPSFELNTSSDSGVSNSDHITNDTDPIFQGIAEYGSKIELKDSSDTLLATAYANKTDGNYTVSLDGLNDGNYSLKAIATDAAGNAKEANLTLQIDTFGDTPIVIAMAAASDTGISDNDQITSDTTPTITTDRETTLTVLDENNNTVQTLDTSSETAILDTLSDGKYTIEGGVKGTDTAGNPLSYNTTMIQIDTTKPSLTSPTALDENATVTPSSLHVYNTATADASSVTYTLGGSDASYFSIDPITGIVTLSDIANVGATYSVDVTATDAAGNSDTYTISVTPQRITPTATAKITLDSPSAVASDGNYTVVGLEKVDSYTGLVNLYKTLSNGSLQKVATIKASDGAKYDYFGSSVAIDGAYIVVGAKYADKAYLYEIQSDETLKELAILSALDDSGSLYFGTSVAISGDYIAVGAPNTRAAYLFKRNSDNTVSELSKMTGLENYGDAFGNSIAISGDYIVIGAYGEDSVNDQTLSDVGAAYVFKRNDDTNVTQFARVTLDDAQGSENFGNSVAISEQYIVIGAQGKTVNSNYQGGRAYVYKIGSQDMKKIATLSASDGYRYDYFGQSVGIAGKYIVVGSKDYDNGSKGAAYLYKIDNEDSITELKKLVAPDSSNSSPFAKSVAVADKKVVSLSAKAAYLYDIFANKPYIPALEKNVTVGESLSTTIYALPFSTNVDSGDISYTLSGDDADKFTITDRVIHSNSALDYETPSDANQDNTYNITLELQNTNGRVNAYDMNISVVDRTYLKDTKVQADDADYSDNFGASSAVSGKYVLVGARNEDANGEYDAGSAYLFEKALDGTLTQVSKLTASDASRYNYFAQAVAMDQDYIVIGATEAAYLYKINSDGTITQLAKLSADDGEDGDYFGSSVAISGDYIVVGAYGDGDNGSDAGSAYVFKKDADGNVVQLAKIIGSSVESYDNFGNSVDIDGDFIVVGASRANNNAYLFEIKSDGSVDEISSFTTSDSKSYFGDSVDISGNYVVVSNEGRDSVYLFKKASDNSVSQVAKITSDDALYFGSSLAIDGDVIAVGDKGKKTVTIFTKDANDIVSKVQTLSEGTQLFGSNIAIDNDTIVIGDSEDDTSYTNSGALYLYIKDPNQP